MELNQQIEPCVPKREKTGKRVELVTRSLFDGIWRCLLSLYQISYHDGGGRWGGSLWSLLYACHLLMYSTTHVMKNLDEKLPI